MALLGGSKSEREYGKYTEGLIPHCLVVDKLVSSHLACSEYVSIMTTVCMHVCVWLPRHGRHALLGTVTPWTLPSKWRSTCALWSAKHGALAKCSVRGLVLVMWCIIEPLTPALNGVAVSTTAGQRAYQNLYICATCEDQVICNNCATRCHAHHDMRFHLFPSPGARDSAPVCCCSPCSARTPYEAGAPLTASAKVNSSLAAAGVLGAPATVSKQKRGLSVRLSLGVLCAPCRSSGQRLYCVDVWVCVGVSGHGTAEATGTALQAANAGVQACVGEGRTGRCGGLGARISKSHTRVRCPRRCRAVSCRSAAAHRSLQSMFASWCLEQGEGSPC